MAKEIKMTVVEELGVLHETDNSKLVFSITDVNGVEKYDIRQYFMKKDDTEWQMGKGIRLTEDEMKELVKLAKKIK